MLLFSPLVSIFKNTNYQEVESGYFFELSQSLFFLGLYVYYFTPRYVHIWEINQLIEILLGNPGMKNFSGTQRKYK